MRITRRTLAPLALPCALLLALTGAASAQAAIAITSPGAGAIVNDTTPTVTFTGATPSSTVTLIDGDGDPIATGSTGAANGSGAGTITPTAAVTSDPRDVVSFAVVDVSTDQSPYVNVTIDQVPELSGNNSDAVDAADVSLDASSAIPGNAVQLWDAGANGVPGGGDDVLLKTATADEDGLALGMVPTTPLTAGTHTVYAVTKDDGNVASSPSEGATVKVAPAAPAYTSLSDNARVNQLRPAIAIHNVDASATHVTLYEVEDVSGSGTLVQIGDTTTVTSHTATVTPSTDFADGFHSLVITQTVNGLESLPEEDGAGVQIEVKTSPPVLETSFSGTVTNDTHPYFFASNTLTNNGGNHTYAVLYIDGVRAGASDPQYGGGDSSIQADDPIAEGAHTAYAVTVDDLGHESATRSNTVAFTIDTVGPAAATVTSPADGSTVATSLPVVTISHAEPGSSTGIFIDDAGEEVEQTADADGNATFVLTQPLADGMHTVHVFSSDAAGNSGDFTTTTFTVVTAKAPPTPTPPVTPKPPVTPVTPAAPADPDHDGIANDWTVGGKAAPAPATPKASISDGKVTLKLAAAPKGAKTIRVYRADGNGDYKLVKTLTPKSKTFTDAKVKPGHSYKYKTVGVNAKGQQGKASGTATAKVKKTK